MAVRNTVRKWGNSLGLRLQRGIAEELKLQDGSCVEMQVSGNRLIVTPCAPRYSLEELVDRIDESNLHGEIGTGGPAGNEAW